MPPPNPQRKCGSHHLLPASKPLRFPSKALEALPDIYAKSGKNKKFRIATSESIESEIATTHKIGARFVLYGTPEYPEVLQYIYDSPPVLTMLGRPELLQHKNIVALVGARNASINGRKMARNFARDLGEKDIVVASGLARGIDTEAHNGALDTGTIAVTACGIDVIYPPENKQLYHQLAKQGAIITEQPLGAQPHQTAFPKRNRIISGLSRGVLVVEASLRSGSLITARMANEQGREVFAIPGTPLDPRSRGGNTLIKQGATLTESVEDIVTALQGNTMRIQEAPAPHYKSVTLTEENENMEKTPQDTHNSLMKHLGPSPVLVDELIAECQVPSHTVTTLLMELELAGRIERHPGGKVSLLVE